jgi:hypothetical protein
MTAGVLFLALRHSGAAAEATMRSLSAIARQRQEPIRPDAPAIKPSPAVNNLNASKLGNKDKRVAVSAGGFGG